MSMTEAVSQDAGWSALLNLGFRPSPDKTVLAKRERFGPLAVQRPFYPEGEVCHVYLLHPPGGVAGGDQLRIDAESAPASRALVTTPGATKFYRSAGALAYQTQHLRIADAARLEWMPQENIFFPGAQVNMRTRVDLHGAARLTFWEIHCLGLPVIQEDFNEGNLDSRLEIRRDGKPLLLERLRVDPHSRLRSSLLGGKPVTGTAVFSHAERSHLGLVRDRIDALAIKVAGATLIEDLLVVRYLGDSTEQARKVFTDIWSVLREPLMDRPASLPRIWNT